MGAVGIWLTGLLLMGVVVQLEPPMARVAQLWGAAFTVLMLATVITWAMVGQHLASMDARDKWHVVIVAAQGLMWALPPLIFFAPAQPLVTMFMVCMVCGMSAAGVPIFGTRPALYALIFVPPFVAQIAVFGWYGLQTGETFHGFLGAAMVLLLTVNLIFSRFTWATLNRSIVLAYENQELVQQLKSQAVQLSETTRAAQEANKAKTKFLAAASHDLRQPVHALNLFTEVLAGTQLDDKQTSMVQHIRAATHASRDMLNTLLDYSRIEAGVMVAKPVPTPLAPLLRRLEDEFGPQADAQNLIYRTRDTQLVALCDPTMTQLILRNFVSNALRYTQTGGVLVAARQRASEVIVQVIDTGIGIARHQHDEIFKEFHQLGNLERDRQKGLGLGLAIAKGLAQSMRARIELQSQPGQGSVFTLCLRSASNLGEEPSNAAEFAVRSGGWMAAQLRAPALSGENQVLHQALRGLRVLIVDDEAQVRVGLEALLHTWGCEVRQAEGLEDALTCIQGGFAAQLLITDYRLRDGITGGDVIAALRSQSPSLPAIIVTGDTDPKRIREAAGHGAMLLHKPVSVATLQAAMMA